MKSEAYDFHGQYDVDFVTFTKPDVPPPSISFFDRCCGFFASQRAAPIDSPVWTGIAPFHARVANMLSEKRASELRDYFADLCNREVVSGLGGNQPWTNPPGHFEAAWYNKLVSAGMASGSLAVFNREQPARRRANVKQIWADIEHSLGARIHCAGGGGRIVGIIEGRNVTYSMLVAVCYWLRLKKLLPQTITNILEIGAGLGGSVEVFSAIRSTQYRQCQYHTIDLPVVSLFPALFTAIACGENSVWFSGEPESKTAWLFVHGLECDLPELDLAINVDSLPEMAHRDQLAYANLISRNLCIGGLFLSVNHESFAERGSRVFDLMLSLHHLTEIERSPFWGRPGYVQEIWRKGS